MTHEETARLSHRCGHNCAQSVYSAFADALGVTPQEAERTAPLPRSEGGKCGAFLAGRALLERLKPSAVPEFEAAFEQSYGAMSCRALVASHRRLRKSCNDFVGETARLVERLISEKA